MFNEFALNLRCEPTFYAPTVKWSEALRVTLHMYVRFLV